MEYLTFHTKPRFGLRDPQLGRLQHASVCHLLGREQPLSHFVITVKTTSNQIGSLNIEGLFQQRISSIAMITLILKDILQQILHSLMNY